MGFPMMPKSDKSDFHRFFLPFSDIIYILPVLYLVFNDIPGFDFNFYFFLI